MNSFDCYLIAATIAEKASKLYPNTSKLQSRSICCRMAAACINVQRLESLDRPSLQKLSELIEILLETDPASVSPSVSLDRSYLVNAWQQHQHIYIVDRISGKVCARCQLTIRRDRYITTSPALQSEIGQEYSGTHWSCWYADAMTLCIHIHG